MCNLSPVYLALSRCSCGGHVERGTDFPQDGKHLGFPLDGQRAPSPPHHATPPAEPPLGPLPRVLPLLLWRISLPTPSSSFLLPFLVFPYQASAAAARDPHEEQRASPPSPWRQGGGRGNHALQRFPCCPDGFQPNCPAPSQQIQLPKDV